MKIKKKYWLLWIACLPIIPISAQIQITLDLFQTIQLASDSSLAAFRAKNMYLSGYWEYRTYKANRLPSLTLNMTPAQYYRDITRRYDSQQDLDIYRTQQSFYASSNLYIRQNLDLTGGTFYLQSELGYMRNFGHSNITQITSIPLKLGYSQNLIGYNAFKWERRIEPLKYERVKKEFIYNVEQVSEQATSHFFVLAMAQEEYDLAKNNAISFDTLYRIGKERYKIASISQADLLTLKLDFINAQNTLQNKESNLKKAMFALASFLNLDQNTVIKLKLPTRLKKIQIPIEKALEWGEKNNPQFLQLKQNILEAKQNVDKTKKESQFNVCIDASIGFNQVATEFSKVYRKPLQQDLVAISVSIPLVDWGVRKGKYNMAQNNLNIIEISARQDAISIEEEITMTVNDFHIQQRLVDSTEEALNISIMAYNETKERFVIGKADINSLTLAHNRQQQAQQNYISSLQNYWRNYYKIRRLTLFDFVNGLPLSEQFDYNGGNLIK